MSRPTHPWTEREDATLRKLYPTTTAIEIAVQLGRRASQVYTRADKLGLKKEPQAVRAAAQRAIANPEHGGRQHWFKAGNQAWNSGKNFNAGGNAPKSRFKPGHTPHTIKPIGTVRVSQNLLAVKLSDTGYTNHDWANLHVLVWQSQHGPVPPGHLVIFADGNTRNFADSNLLLVSRVENMRRNSIHTRLPRELKRTVMALGRLKRKIREKQDQ
jgi:hypothetical protein